jgi:hypothetical protein
MRTDPIGEFGRGATSLNVAVHSLFRNVACKDTLSVFHALAKIAVSLMGAAADA